MQVSNLMTKRILDVDVHEYAALINKAAVKNRYFAEELVKMGLRGNMNSKRYVRLLDPKYDMFDKAGNMTEKGKKNIVSEMSQLYGFSDKKIKRATVKDYIEGICSYIDRTLKTFT